jgi:carboxylesterase
VILVVLALVALQLVIAALLAFVPVSQPDTDSRPRPAQTYAEAVDRFDAIRDEEADAAIDAECRSRLLSKQGRTAVAVVVFHRLGGCTADTMRLARAFHARGANVFVVRLPEHGGGDLGAVSAEDLRVAADGAVDIGVGLGREVRVFGVSLGGVMAAWVAQNRGDVGRAVVVAPPLTVSGGSDLVDYMYVNAFRRLPDLGFDVSTRTTAAMQQLADDVVEDAITQAPRAKSIAVVTNRNDEGADPTTATTLAANWRDHGGDVRGYEFAKRLQLPQDLSDPAASGARPGVTYPVLLRLVMAPTGS